VPLPIHHSAHPSTHPQTHPHPRMHTTHLVGHAEQEVAVVVRVSKQAEARQKEEEGERAPGQRWWGSEALEAADSSTRDCGTGRQVGQSLPPGRVEPLREAQSRQARPDEAQADEAQGPS
jgi:hypothetical protein